MDSRRGRGNGGTFWRGDKGSGGSQQRQLPRGGGRWSLPRHPCGECPLKGTSCLLMPEMGMCWVTLAKGRGGSAL